jgi:cytochrome c553
MKIRRRSTRSLYQGLFIATLLLGSLIVPAITTAVTAATTAAQEPLPSPQVPTPEQAAFFEKNIQPILTNHCYDCHSTQTKSAGGLRLDDHDALLKGGRTGPAIVPGHPEDSLLLQRVLTDDVKKRMPKGEDEPLSAKEIADLKTWIQQGALWPVVKETGTPSATAAQPVHAKAVSYPRPSTPEQLAYFEKNVRPILVNRCYNCHSDAFKEAGGLRVDVGISIFAGGNDGPVLIPGHPEKSLLIERVKSADSKKRMPQETNEALPPAEVTILETWIKNGAAWPDETEKLPQTPARLAAAYPKLKAHYWSWQPLADPVVPVLADKSSSTNIDHFILAKLQEKKLAQVKEADPITLIRRVSYDLTGLPPTPAEVKEFQKNHSEQAYAKLVDRLLASQQFGERWGRHWLDVARYAESSGPSRNMPYPNAWRYRDYVIDSFNKDIPYNRFIQEQLAGDLLPAATPAEHDRLLIATGFLALGPKDVNQRFKARFKMDNVDDEIDTVTRSTMALTVSCARCHDHKFDPIPATDYYALAGIFTSTEDDTGLGSKMGGSSLGYYEPKQLGYLSTASTAAPIPKEQIDKLKSETEVARKKFEALQKANAEEAKTPHTPPSESEKQRRLAIAQDFIQHREDLQLIEDLGERGYGVHSVRDGVIADTTVRIRGIEERHGPAVPRGFLTVLNLPNTPQIPTNHSGRLELAQWITRPDNPLSSRVYVNRVWQHLFGVGIVSSLDNFGTTGDQPSNPALLDYLAQDFIRNGWSTKKLVRELVLTHSYRLGSDVPSGYRDIDPADHYVWRHAPRRLEAEEIRDSILASSGQLSLEHPKGSPTMALRMIEMRDDGPVVGSILSAADRSPYRSIYLPLLRDETPRPLAAFDPVTQTLVTGQRDVTTVPTQALFMLNSPFVRQQSLKLASQLLAEPHRSDAERTSQAYELVFGHDPTPQDTARIRSFLARYSSTWLRSHPQSSPLNKEHVALVRSSSSPSTQSITSGIVRSDGLAQDDSVETPTHEDALSVSLPDSAKEAAWAAIVQSLYGSAAFQFVR